MAKEHPQQTLVNLTGLTQDLAIVQCGRFQLQRSSDHRQSQDHHSPRQNHRGLAIAGWPDRLHDRGRQIGSPSPHRDRSNWRKKQGAFSGFIEPLFLDREFIRDKSLNGKPIAPGELTFRPTGRARGTDRDHPRDRPFIPILLCPPSAQL